MEKGRKKYKENEKKIDKKMWEKGEKARNKRGIG